MTRHINPETAVLIDITDAVRPAALTWGEFVADNAEALGAAEMARIERTLLFAGTAVPVFGGGGAGAEWTIRLAP